MDKKAISKIEDFRKMGKIAIDWIADYLLKVDTYSVNPPIDPGDIIKKLNNSPPELPEEFDNIINDLEKIIMPGIMHWQSPNFFGYFPASASGPSIIGDLISSGLGVQGMMWATSPACTELEINTLDWIVQMLGLPDFFYSKSNGGGVIQDTASSSSLCSILTAREEATSYKSNYKGAPSNLIAYTSEEAHSSIEKGIKISGIGKKNLRIIGTDSNQSLNTTELIAAINQDIKNGNKPFYISATIGTTSSHGIDQIDKIGKIAKEYKLWLHIDAAMAGTAAICEEFRFIHQGLEYADSYTFNPHKWMLTNFDCSLYYVRDRNKLINTLSIMPEYLRNDATKSKEVIDYRDWHIPLGRRFRSLKLWMVIRSYGVNGIRNIIRSHIKMTKELAGWIKGNPNFIILKEPILNLVCFRHVDGNKKTKSILTQVNKTGTAFITHTVIDDLYYIRVCIGQEHTTKKNIHTLWKLIVSLDK